MGKRRKIPKGQINRRNNQTIQALKNLMEDLGQKYSIRVGIIGEQAYEKHPHTDLTNAQLGAIHEFGTDTIPARSFLRDTLLSADGKDRLMAAVDLDDDRELNKELALLRENRIPNYMDKVANIIGSTALALVIGGENEDKTPIVGAFEAGGRPKKWQDVKPITRKRRKHDSTSPPLTDEGWFRDSISVEVKKHG